MVSEMSDEANIGGNKHVDCYLIADMERKRKPHSTSLNAFWIFKNTNTKQFPILSGNYYIRVN